MTTPGVERIYQTPRTIYCWAPLRPSRRAALILAGCTVATLILQAVPFLAFPLPDAHAIAQGSLPPNFPAAYTVTDFLRARALDLAGFWSGILRTVTTVCTLLALLYSGLPERFGQISTPKAYAWLARLLFLGGIFLCSHLVELPFLYGRHIFSKALGLSLLGTAAWFQLLLAGWIVPGTLFVLKYLIVTCTLPLCGRFWWLAAASSLFVIGDVVPDLVARTYPLDPIEQVHRLERGPHFDAMESMLQKAGFHVPIMVTDEAHRSNSSDICLTGRPGREYVLLTDTFLRDYSPDQVTLALAHELGHFQHRKAVWLMDKASSLVLFFLSFGLVYVLSGRNPLPIQAAPRTVLLSVLCVFLVGRILSPLFLVRARGEERFADRYALQLVRNNHGFEALLLKVAQKEFEPLDVPAWRYSWSWSHPTFLERISFASKF